MYNARAIIRLQENTETRNSSEVSQSGIKSQLTYKGKVGKRFYFQPEPAVKSTLRTYVFS